MGQSFLVIASEAGGYAVRGFGDFYENARDCSKV
jgi:hypothetical protein